jgi:hypothetical protein
VALELGTSSATSGSTPAKPTSRSGGLHRRLRVAGGVDLYVSTNPP